MFLRRLLKASHGLLSRATATGFVFETHQIRASRKTLFASSSNAQICTPVPSHARTLYTGRQQVPETLRTIYNGRIPPLQKALSPLCNGRLFALPIALRQIYTGRLFASPIVLRQIYTGRQSLYTLRLLPLQMGVRTLSTRRPPPPPGRARVDIAAKARQRQARRFWTVLLSVSGVAAFIVALLYNFQEYLMFYITPTDALEKFEQDPSKNRFRLGGLVLEGSVIHYRDSPDMEFVMTDLVSDILVRYRGTLPDLFREGHSIVAEGFLKPISALPVKNESQASADLDSRISIAEKARSAGCYFAAVEVLAKHDEKYMPKEVAAALERNRAAIEAASDAGESQVPSPATS